MRRASLRVLVVLAIFFGSFGCSYTHLYGETMRGVDLQARHRIYVLHQPKDKQEIDSMIANRLERVGFEVSAGEGMDGAPPDVQAIVSYEDHWQWDMSMYLITLRIDFRDPQTQELLASGQSYRTSLDRKPPEFMVDEIFTSMFPGK